MYKRLASKISEWAGQSDGIRFLLSRFLPTSAYKPKSETNHLQTSHPVRTEISIGDAARSYIILRTQGGFRSFTEFPIGVRTKISEDLDTRVRTALANGGLNSLEHLRLSNNGFYADADVLPESPDYSLRVISAVENR